LPLSHSREPQVAPAISGKPYNWGPTAIKNILTNPKYIGIWKWSRFKVLTNPETGKKVRVRQPENEWVYHLEDKDAIDSELIIISREKWEGAQQRLHGSSPFGQTSVSHQGHDA